MDDETPEQAAMRAATLAVRQILAQAKNPNTVLGRMSPTGVALRTAWAAIEAHRDALGQPPRARPGLVQGVPARHRVGPVPPVRRPGVRQPQLRPVPGVRRPGPGRGGMMTDELTHSTPRGDPGALAARLPGHV